MLCPWRRILNTRKNTGILSYHASSPLEFPFPFLHMSGYGLEEILGRHDHAGSGRVVVQGLAQGCIFGKQENVLGALNSQGRVAGYLCGHFHALVKEALLVRVYLIDKIDSPGLFRVEGMTAEGYFPGVARADDPGQTLESAHIGDDRKPGFGESENGIG